MGLMGKQNKGNTLRVSPIGQMARSLQNTKSDLEDKKNKWSTSDYIFMVQLFIRLV